MVDSHYHVQIAVTGGGNLYYATNRTGSWTHRRVLTKTSSFSYGQPSIAVDENDRVHIAVMRFPNGEGGDGIWYVSDVGRNPGTFPSSPSKIAPDTDGEPVLKASHGHLFLVDVNGWCCVGDGTVQLRTNVSGSWTVSSVGTGQEPSFRLGADQRAQVVFDRNDTQPGIYYGRASSPTGGFTTARLAGTSDHDLQPLLALDTNHQPWISWRHFSNDSLNVIAQHHTQSGWHSPKVAVSGISAENIVGFDVDSLGRPNVAYGNVAIRERVLKSGTWHPSTVANAAYPRALVLRRSLDGEVIVAWTSDSGVWVSER